MRAWRCVSLVALGTLCLLLADVARADVYGRIRGIVTDPSGGVVPKANIVALNTATGISAQAVSGADGNYEFLQLAAPGIYNVSAEASGFKKAEVDGIHLELNQIFVENLQLQLGSVSETVTVTENAITQVETTSIELGTTINSTEIVNAPLNGRSFIDLMKLQPGVVEASDARGGTNYGNYATNGSEADQNSYLINGTDNNDLALNEVQINVSPDAISEFRMVTNTINPEYGRNSGAIINATIKSGTNQFHGSGFDFYRDTSLNAKNFFQPMPEVFHRNQFGGTVGGPIRKDKTFFFFSYQGFREREPEASAQCGCASPGTAQVFTNAERAGTFQSSPGVTDIGSSGSVSPFPLIGQNGTTYPAGTPYTTLFPTGIIPTADINPVAKNLLADIPVANTAGNLFEFNPVVRGLDDQFLTRVDQTFGAKDSVWAYALWERQPSSTDLSFYGGDLPGSGETDGRHWQQYTAAWNHSFSASTLNEARMGYTRFNYKDVNPTNPVLPSSVGFTGITPQYADGAGIPNIIVNGPSASALNFSLGFSPYGPQPRIDQTYQASDSITKIVGNHSLKFGFTMSRFEDFNPYYARNSGEFSFAGAGPFSTGDAGADFLLGIPDSYEQESGDYLNLRTREYYSYFQDQWKIRPNLTITFGTGWSIDTPEDDIAHDNHAGVAFRPGQQSTIFPTAPEDYVFQGDAGVNAFGTTKYNHFGPRLGFAYSPDWGWITGGPGKTSIRAGYGIYYNRFSSEPGLQTQGSPPFAENSFGIGDIGGSPNFANPFSGYMPITDSSGAVIGSMPISIPNKFPYTPSATPNFANLEPLSVSVYDPTITVPYAENYNLTIERQLGASTLMTFAYVGSEGRHLILDIELNPGINPAGCAANPACVAERTTQPYNFPQNYKYPGNIFGSVGDVTTGGTSNYNAFQATLNHSLSHGLQMLMAYTYSHALDLASGFENSGFGGSGSGGFGELRSTNPFNPHLDYGDSNYDARHRLVISYVYNLPSVRRFKAFEWIPSRVADGWNVSGITTFQSGFPLDVVDSAFPSLTSSYFQWYTCGGCAGWDVPNLVGPITYMNPRVPTTIAPNTSPSNYWFSPATTPVGCSSSAPPCREGAFSAPPFGTEGDAGRDIIHGPGRNNFDFAVMKDTRITESIKIEMRFEFFNVFNHTQFNPNGINTDFNSSGFGTETQAFDPRIIQLAGKVYF